MVKGKFKAIDRAWSTLQMLQELREEEILVGCKQARWFS
jgi:hypothetical protein